VHNAFLFKRGAREGKYYLQQFVSGRALIGAFCEHFDNKVVKIFGPLVWLLKPRRGPTWDHKNGLCEGQRKEERGKEEEEGMGKKREKREKKERREEEEDN
jgi:hypothetical protein